MAELKSIDEDAHGLDEAEEYELKLELPPGRHGRLQRLPRVRGAVREAPVQENEVSSVYFDTGKFKLRKNGVLLRVRRVGDRRLQTVKTYGSENGLARGEWEREISGDQPDLDAARGTALEALLTKGVRRGLKPVFETKVQRKTVPVRCRKSEIEVSVDEGWLRSNGHAAAIAEVELELKRGNPPIYSRSPET